MRPSPDRALAPLLKSPRTAWPTVALAAAIAAAIALSLAAAITRVVPAPACVALSTLAAYATFTVLHEASHGLVSRRRSFNAFCGHLAASVLLVRFLAFRQIHRRHHRHTGDPARDPDAWCGEGPAWQLPLRWATADLHYYLEYDPAEPLTPRDHRGSWISLAALLGAIAALLLTGHLRELFFCWILPARIAFFFLTYTFDFIPHHRPHGVPASIDPFRATFLVRGRALDGLLLYQNLHLVHHLHPTAPFYRYRRIWNAASKDLLARGAREVSLLALPRADTIATTSHALPLNCGEPS